VSLTIVDVNKDRFRIALIPHTLETTTLGRKLQGAAVNVEVDVISKYVERHLAARQPFREPSLAELVGPPPVRPEALAAQSRIPVPAPAPRPVPAPSRPVPTAARPAPKPSPAKSPARPKSKPKPSKTSAHRSASVAKRSTPPSARRRKPSKKR